MALLPVEIARYSLRMRLFRSLCGLTQVKTTSPRAEPDPSGDRSTERNPVLVKSTRTTGLAAPTQSCVGEQRPITCSGLFTREDTTVSIQKLSRGFKSLPLSLTARSRASDYSIYLGDDAPESLRHIAELAAAQIRPAKRAAVDVSGLTLE